MCLHKTHLYGEIIEKAIYLTITFLRTMSLLKSRMVDGDLCLNGLVF